MDDSFQSYSIINEENRGTSTTGNSFREWRLIALSSYMFGECPYASF